MKVLLVLIVLRRIGAQSFLSGIRRRTRFNEFAIPEVEEDAVVQSERVTPEVEEVADTAEEEEEFLSSVVPLAPPGNYLEEAEEAENAPLELTSPSLGDQLEPSDDFTALEPGRFFPPMPSLNRSSSIPAAEEEVPVVNDDYDPFFRFPSSPAGCISVGLQSSSTSTSPRTVRWANRDSTFSESTIVGPDDLDVSVGVRSLIKLAALALSGSTASGAALAGTLRMLAPLLVARRVLVYLGDMANDWYTGRYLRRTYSMLEKEYWHFYQVTALVRSGGRFLAQLVLSAVLGRIVQGLLGLRRYPCIVESTSTDDLQSILTGAFWGCSALWMLATLGGSFSIGKLISEWHGSLRLTLEPESSVVRTAQKRRRLLLHPLNILEWMRDPHQVVKAVLRTTPAKVLKPFHPEPFFFPSTWLPIRMIEYVAVLREMGTSHMSLIMRRLLVQQALFDEWNRALMKEKRVALGLGIMCMYSINTCMLCWSVGVSNGRSALLMLPAVLSSFMSVWMNAFIYFDRRDTNRLIEEEVEAIAN